MDWDELEFFNSDKFRQIVRFLKEEEESGKSVFPQGRIFSMLSPLHLSMKFGLSLLDKILTIRRTLSTPTDWHSQLDLELDHYPNPWLIFFVNSKMMSEQSGRTAISQIGQVKGSSYSIRHSPSVPEGRVVILGSDGEFSLEIPLERLTSIDETLSTYFGDATHKAKECTLTQTGTT